MPNCSMITLAGHLGRDAELKSVGDTNVLKWSMAVTHKQKSEKLTTWYACEMWGTRGEALSQYLTKGTAVLVIGDLRPREYKGKQDELRLSLDVRVNNVELLGGGEKRQEAPAPAPSQSGYDDGEVF